jgi:hypothetical protein
MRSLPAPSISTAPWNEERFGTSGHTDRGPLDGTSLYGGGCPLFRYSVPQSSHATPNSAYLLC